MKPYEEIDIDIMDLLLDPNNPRFIKDLNTHVKVQDDGLVSAQVNTMNRFTETSVSTMDDQDDSIDITTLIASMKEIGYVPIDRIVVRAVTDSSKYLVIEGNRRVCTMKKLINAYNSPSTSLKEKEKMEAHLPGFRKISCLLFKTTGLSENEIARQVMIILGLRHHGSLLEWEPLPKACNVFTVYMSLEPHISEFEFINSRVIEVQSRLSICRRKVLSSLKTYVVFKQLREHYFEDIKDDHYSLIEALVVNTNLIGNYIQMNRKTYLLDEPSIYKVAELLQFGIRDRHPLPEGIKRIIEKPQDFSKLGRLVRFSDTDEDKTTRDYACSLVRRVENPKDDLKLKTAMGDMIKFKARLNWTIEVASLIDQQETNLSLEDYSGTGNDRGNKDALKKTLMKLQRVLG